MIKVGIIGTRGIPNNYGGFEQFAQQISEYLSEKDCEVFVYNSHNHPFKEKKWDKVNIIHKYDPEFLIGLAGQFIYDFNCIIDSRKRKFDVLIQLGYTTNSIWSFLLPKKPFKICNPDGMEWKRAKYPLFIKKFLKFAEKLAVKSNDVLIADSNVIKKYYINKYNKKTYFIAYSAEIFKNNDITKIESYNVKPYDYFLLIARFQEDNNLETIIKGVLESKTDKKLLIIGNNKNKYGKYLTKKYNKKNIVFLGAIYRQDVLNNLRYYSKIYFHGHSAGGTNPSLLEAMASSALICANNNDFNKSVLKENGFYFDNFNDIASLITKNFNKFEFQKFIDENKREIELRYNKSVINEAYYNVIMKKIE